MASVKRRVPAKKSAPSKSRPRVIAARKPARTAIRLKKAAFKSVIKAAAKVSRNGKSHPHKAKSTPPRRPTERSRPQRCKPARG